MKIEQQDFTVYYSYECPYVEYGVKELSNYAKENNLIINFIKIINITFEIKMYIKLYFVMIYK